MSTLLAKVMQTQALLAERRLDDAAKVIGPVAQQFPKDPNAASLYSIVLFQQRKYPQALHYAQRAVALLPTDAHYHANLGLMLMANGKPKEAKASYLKAVEIQPDHPEATLSLANDALQENNARAAATYCRRILDLRWDPQICPTYMAALAGLGEIDEAIAFGAKAVEVFPNDSLLFSNRCSNFNYSWNSTPEMIARAHRDFGRVLMAEKPQATFTFKGSRDPDRRLRVGFVSTDLRAHSVCYFIEPFLERHDRERFEVYAYSTSRHEDAVSRRLETHVKAWRKCGDLIDIEICRMVEADGIDILIDLGGLTQNNSATVFAYKPAPVQATYCGYPNTVGLPTIDWRLVDAITDPLPGSSEARAAKEAGQPDFDERCAERLMRLAPCFLCYRPPREAPEPTRDASWPHPTFGSFNANKKIVNPLLERWAELMRRVPDSHFILKTFEFKDEFPRERIYKAFEQGGVARDRIHVMGPAKTVAEHLAIYSRIDVALDTMPYNGTTTTCEALWMGVPVITTAGATHAARVSASLLSCVGAHELIAPSVDAMLDQAASLVVDRERLASYRSGLRAKVASSLLCDGAHFAAEMDKALRAMWRAWCERTS